MENDINTVEQIDRESFTWITASLHLSIMQATTSADVYTHDENV